MPTISETLKLLAELFDDERRLLADIQRGRENRLRSGFAETRLADLEGDLERCRRRLTELLEYFEREPPHHSRHFEKLFRFARDQGQFEKSVFIMTKYPRLDGGADTREAERLACAIGHVKNGVAARGYVPHLASDTSQHRWLWDNVELYMLGCHKGIAIVEDRYASELNPNVAMEWGWMQGMGRQVLYLREQSFEHQRADWEGLLSEEFDWDAPGTGIETGLTKFLGARP